MNSCFDEPLPRISAGDPIGTDPLVNPTHIAGGMRRLDGRDHTVLSEQSEIGNRHDLGVLDAPAPVVVSLQNRGVSVEYCSIRAIADRVCRNLKAAIVRLSPYPFDSLAAKYEQARVSGVYEYGSRTQRHANPWRRPQPV